MKQEVEEEKLKVAMISRAESIVKAGITTVRDLGGGKHQELVVRDLIKKKKITGPRLICAGQPITSRGGHCRFWGGEADCTEEAYKGNKSPSIGHCRSHKDNGYWEGL